MSNKYQKKQIQAYRNYIALVSTFKDVPMGYQKGKRNFKKLLSMINEDFKQR